jgi:hypothetical protein
MKYQATGTAMAMESSTRLTNSFADLPRPLLRDEQGHSEKTQTADQYRQGGEDTGYLADPLLGCEFLADIDQRVGFGAGQTAKGGAEVVDEHNGYGRRE